MQGKAERLQAFGRQLTVYLPPGREKERLPAAYLHDGEMVEGMLEELAACIERGVQTGGCRPFLLVAVHSPDRDAEYTPWPARCAFPKGADYPGKAQAYVKLLEGQIKPLVDSRYPTLQEAEETALCGYSLGGLCSLYAAVQSRTFGRIASVSGSLWYPGWLDFVRENRPAGELAALWVSIGRKESAPSHPLLAGAGEAAQQTLRLLAPFARQHIFFWHEGGHFAHAAQRLAGALCWLFQKEGSDEER